MTSAAIIVLGALGLEMEAVWAITFGGLTNSLAIVPHLGFDKVSRPWAVRHNCSSLC